MAAHEQPNMDTGPVCVSACVAAFASVVLRSKPGNIALQDYLHRLYDLSILRSDSRPVRPSERLDASTDTAKSTNKLLQKDNQIQALQEENGMLRAALQIPDVIDTFWAQTDAVQQQDCQPVRQAVLATLDQPRSADLLVGSLFMAQKFLKRRSDTDRPQLHRCLHETIRNIGATLLEIQQSPTTGMSTTSSRSTMATQLCSRAISVVYEALDALFLDHTESTQHDAASFALLQLFHDLLARLINEGIDDVTINRTASVLSGMLRQLHGTSASHKKLFEGYMFILLAITGVQLHHLVFGHARQANLDGATRCGNGKLHTSTIEQARFEVRQQARIQLIRLLKQAVDQSSSFLTNDSNHSSHTATVRQRLQRTLFEAIFGQDSYTKAITCGIQPLMIPQPNVQLDIVVPNDTSAEDWFVQEMWNTVGWDILLDDKTDTIL